MTVERAADPPIGDDASKLLRYLAPPDAQHLFAAMRGRGIHRRGTLDALRPWLSTQNAEGYNIYYLPQAVDGERRRLRDITAIRALFVDLDNGGLPADLPCLDGAVVVETSSDRYQVVWPIPRISIHDFHAYIGGLLKALPCADRRAKDEARLLRLPGFKNTKPGRDGALARIIREPTRNLTIEDLALFPRDDDYAREVCARREPGRTAIASISDSEDAPRAPMNAKAACSVAKAWVMAQTIIRALRKGGEHRLTVRMQDGDSWEAGVKTNQAWRKLAISVVVAVGNVEAALPIIDMLSRGDYLTPRSRAEVRNVYDWVRNLSIYKSILSPADFVELTGNAAVTHKTFNAAHQAARKVLGVTRAVHARSNEVMTAIRAGRSDGERIATEAHITIIIRTRPGKFRDFLLEIWGNLRRGGNRRHALTVEAKNDLMARMRINDRTLANFITKAGAFFAIAPGRYAADRTVYIGWLDSSDKLAADLARETHRDAKHDDSLSRLEVNSSPKEIVLFCAERGSNEIQGTDETSDRQAQHISRPAGDYRWAGVDEVGLGQLQALATESTYEASEAGFWLHLMEKGVAHWRIDEALASATTRAAKVHAEGVGSEIWHICRSTKLARHQAAAIIARANASVLWQIENGHLDAADARLVLKAYRRALARKALDFGIWTPGAERLQHQAEWLARKSAEDELGSPTSERNARGADIA